MAAQFLFDLVDPAELTGYAREFDNEVLKNQMGLEAFLPNEANPELEYRVMKSKFQDYDVATYRAFDTPPSMAARQGFEAIRGRLVPVSRQIPLTEEEILTLRSLQTGKNATMIKQIFDDVEHMVRSVQMRIEVARGQVLTTGKFTLNENGLILEADFGMPAGNKPTAGAAWSNSATDILADLLTWTQLYVDTNGIMPGLILTSRTVLGYMYNNVKLREAAGFAGTVPSRLNNETIDAIFAANGLPPVMLYDTMARVNGVQTRIIPNDKLLLLPPAGEKIGATFYGITAESLVLAGKGYIVEEDMPGIVALNLRNENPVQTFTLATAVAVPVLPEPRLVICADVIP